MLDLKGYCQRLGLDWDVEDGEDDKPALSAEEDEELSCSFADVELAVGEDGTSAGQGTVYITTRRLIWVGDANSSGSIACHYRQISMHAVARDTEAFSRPCVYIQLDEGSEVMQDNDDEEEEEEQLSAELRLVPQDEVQVEAIFSKLCECSALNPDTDAEEEAGAQLFFDEAEVSDCKGVWTTGLSSSTKADSRQGISV
eukprot:GHRR01023042.1.p1 GENE.GHRR01023042.1~~GHRR01023042.1.p1  ORF type:complete len:199 (+),score=62.20 GHRR01023042.1:214-810(+)